MQIALELAQRGKGHVNPNPLVGAIIVKDNQIIGSGYHQNYGEAHAEVNAFDSLKTSAKGATLYVTLEPCCHYGKTPPCVDLIIKHQIAKVVVACLDPNPLVSGKGVQKLKEANIEVVIGVLEEEAIKVNQIFMHYMRTKKPFVLFKTAMTLDGKIATASGDSKWISGEQSRLEVHHLRNELMAIMVGVNTVINDNPLLTCRIQKGRHPIRVIVDSSLRIPLSSQILHNKEAKTIIATTDISSVRKLHQLQELGVEVLVIPKKNNRVDLNALMIELGKLGIDSVLLEGGATLAYSALEAGVVNKVQVYVAPKLIGGEEAKTSVGGVGVSKLQDAFGISNLKVRRVGEDIVLEGDLV